MPETSTKIRTRFAPSPTGFVHIGSLRTELFNFLFTRHNGGTHVLRIEDTDQNRLVAGALENLLKVMKQLNIEFDEGHYLEKDGSIKQRGDYGPYLQSERLDIYHKYAKQLVTQKSAYYCFCSQERLDELRKEQVALKKPPMYDRLCRMLSQEEVDQKMAKFINEGKSPVIRQSIPEAGQTQVHDLIYGEIIIENKILDDQVLIKSDGFPTYHLAVVVDDHLMEITHVIRGDEWIASTPKHILLYQAFGWEAPLFAHAPLIVNPDKSKLSKRQGDVAAEDYLNKGYLPEAIINFIAFLGWNPKTEQEIFSLTELIENFDLANVNRSAAVFDLNKLDWINSHYIRSKPVGELVELLKPFWQQAGVDITAASPEYLQAIVNLEKDRLKKLSEIGERTQYFFQDPVYEGSLLVWKKSDAATTKRILEELYDFIQSITDSDITTAAALEHHLKQFITDRGYDNGSVLWPLRTALTGLEKSPGPFEVAATLALGLGKQEILQRLETAEQKLS
jgi:nondiscriminating glutamyl-tRNA synthetase